MKISYYIFGILWIAVSCTPSAMKNFARTVTGFDAQSIVMVGESKDVIEREMQFIKDRYQDRFTAIESGDTLGYTIDVKELPINTVFVFKDGINVYQELDIFCTPCADEILSQVLKDTRYNFKASDEVNYISTTDLNVVMRLKELDLEEQSCHQVRVYLN